MISRKSTTAVAHIYGHMAEFYSIHPAHGRSKTYAAFSTMKIIPNGYRCPARKVLVQTPTAFVFLEIE